MVVLENKSLCHTQLLQTLASSCKECFKMHFPSNFGRAKCFVFLNFQLQGSFTTRQGSKHALGVHFNTALVSQPGSSTKNLNPRHECLKKTRTCPQVSCPGQFHGHFQKNPLCQNPGLAAEGSSSPCTATQLLHRKNGSWCRRETAPDRMPVADFLPTPDKQIP